MEFWPFIEGQRKPLQYIQIHISSIISSDVIKQQTLILKVFFRPLSSFDTHARWQPVTQSARSRRSYGKIEDCEQSNVCEASKVSKTTTATHSSSFSIRASFCNYSLLIPSFNVLSGYFWFNYFWWRFPLFDFFMVLCSIGPLTKWKLCKWFFGLNAFIYM